MIVVDASVAMKWLFHGEEDRDIALLLYKRHIAQEEEIVVPHLFFYEVANTLATKSNIALRTMKRHLAILAQSHFTIYSESPEDLTEATVLARQYKTSVYDMLYAVLAKRKNCPLITADERFIEKTHFPFVKYLKTISR